MPPVKHSALFFCLGILAVAANAQVQVRLIPPAATEAGIREVHSPHIALHNPSTASRHELLVMIQGTGGSALDCRAFDSCFAEMGYHVVSLDYMNNVITTVCSASPDSNCFDHFRQEIVFGTPVSARVEVDSVNSIVNRLSELLVYLAKDDPAGGWDQFLKGDQPRWDKIVAAGHSQGAGHAAYLGKSFRLAGVLMFSGPQDYLEVFHAPAAWQFRKGRTPVSRYYAFLHLKDPFHYGYQVADVAAVTGRPVTDTTMVYPDTPIRSTRHILVNNIETRNPHGSTIQQEFLPVWRYMTEKLQ
jgi:hypothetical protein